MRVTRGTSYAFIALWVRRQTFLVIAYRVSKAASWSESDIFRSHNMICATNRVALLNFKSVMFCARWASRKIT
jgi:hypothetical protein